MTEIVLTDEQKRQMRAGDSVVIRDADGTVWGSFLSDPLTREDIAELKRRAASPGPWYTSDQVRARMAMLQAEQERAGHRLGRERALELLAEANARDPGHYREPGAGK